MPPPVSLLFDNAANPKGAKVYFTDPVREIRADNTTQVPAALAAMDTAIAQGRWVAGYLSYELGYALEPKLAGLMPPRPGPLIRLFVFDGPRPAPPLAVPSGSAQADVETGTWERYARAFEQAHRYILDGDIYQVNLAIPLRVAISGDPAGLYAKLRREARAGASALLHLGDESVLSFSPETFFTVRDGRIATRPMKGTAARGLDAPGDLRAKRALRANPKERAENLMIVDLLRNDLSRVAAEGSVRTTDLFTVETFPRFHTMTSGVVAELRPGAQLSDILKALFPCGSVTGAPKIRAMEIVHELEDFVRGPYCGATGFAGPEFAAFNVAIRTLTIRDGQGLLPVGSGIVSDSTARQEHQECLLKARFLTQETPDFRLIETYGWVPGLGPLLDFEHDARIAESAAYFGFKASPMAIAAGLELARQESGGAGPARLRLELAADGGVRFSGAALPEMDSELVWRYEIADTRISAADPFRHHKTTERALYNDAIAAARKRGVDEVVFLNERDEVAEGAISNIFVELDGAIVTPPVSSGALNGCLRRAALDLGVEERVITLPDLARATSVWFGNSVRGFVRGVR